MRIKLPNSQIVTVDYVEPFVEKAVTINGIQRVIRQVSNGTEKPTGFSIKLPEVVRFMGDRFIIFGNFNPDTLDEILTNLMKCGDIDLSALRFQVISEEWRFDELVKINDSQAHPYMKVIVGGLRDVEGSALSSFFSPIASSNMPMNAFAASETELEYDEADEED